MARIFVMGSGGFGTSLAIMLNNANHHVSLWGFRPETQENMRQNRENVTLLKGVKIPLSVEIIDNLEGIEDADVVIIATPTIGVRETARMLNGKINKDAVIACVSKGLEPVTLKLISDVIKEEVPYVSEVSLSGPSHAEEISRGVVTAMVAASEDLIAAQRIQQLTEGTHVRIYTSTDIIGVQIGGALKNVIAFAVGILDGLKSGDNTKAALMTRGLTEISRLGEVMGANPNTFAGLSGIGDLIVTCCSLHSRNRRCGVLVGEGYSVTEAIEKVGMVVEGIVATRCAYELSQKHNVEMPIIEQAYLLIEGKITTEEAFSNLLARPLKIESEETWLD